MKVKVLHSFAWYKKGQIIECESLGNLEFLTRIGTLKILEEGKQ